MTKNISCKNGYSPDNTASEELIYENLLEIFGIEDPIKAVSHKNLIKAYKILKPDHKFDENRTADKKFTKNISPVKKSKFNRCITFLSINKWKF